MASVTSRPLPLGGPSADGDEFDNDIFDYDVGGDNDPFSDNYKPQTTTNTMKDNSKDNAELGIDEEVEVLKKPRAPRVKLDENRYGLSTYRGLVLWLMFQITFRRWNPKVEKEGPEASQIQRERS